MLTKILMKYWSISFKIVNLQDIAAFVVSHFGHTL